TKESAPTGTVLARVAGVRCTGRMKRLSVLVIALLAAPVLLAGCGGDKPTTSAPPTAGAPTSGAPATGTVSPGPTQSGTPVPEFTVDGAGPYELGSALT